MKKRILALLLSVSLSMGLFAACSQADATGDVSGAEQENEREVLRVGMECAYAPFNWTQEEAEVSSGDTAVPIEGTNYYAYGYDVMMAKMIAEELDMDIEIYRVEWDAIGLGLDANDYDCIIAGMGITEERSEIYNFTTPYYYREVAITVKKGGVLDGVTGISQFEGLDVTSTTQIGTAWVSLIDQIPGAVVGANYSTTAECFMALSNGGADFTVIDLPTSQSALLTNDDLVILELDEDDTIISDSANVGIATRLDDVELRDKIQGALDSLEWNDKDTMNEMMEEAITLQPAA